MNIYTSTKAMPYVYMGIHKTTGEFYIGYRERNIKLEKASSDDLPIYRTSSKIVKPNFDNYDWYIIAEFYNSNDAYDFEQQLIHENWGNPLLLNKSCYYGKKRCKGGPMSEEAKQKLSKAKKGHISSEETKRKMSEAKKGKSRPKFSEEHKQKIGLANKGKTHTEETKQKMSESKSEETKRKMSESKKGQTLSEKIKRKISESNKGKPKSDEAKMKMSVAQRRRRYLSIPP